MIEPTPGDILLGRGVPINKVYRAIISANAVRRLLLLLTIAIIIHVIIASSCI